MRRQAELGIFACVLCAVLALPSPPAEAGGTFSMHVGTGGFGVSVGVGDWSPYTSSWTNPQFSLDFNATLSGYGEWVWVGNLGRVWRPWVAVGWRPYTYGRWVRTTLGWTWVAYEPWGYVPHHYGSWAMCDFGWVWVPGYSYVSANVVWVRSGGYVGWYARPPRGWSHTARSYRQGYRDGYRDGWHDARYATYVDWHHMGSDNVSHYAVGHGVAARGRVEAHAAPPTAAEVRRRGGISMAETRLSQRTVTMNGRRVTVARPEGVARSIEHHASGTAAEALSPRALERRQPLVRPGSSSSHVAPRVRGEANEVSSDRRLPTGDEFRSPDRSVQREPTAAGVRRIGDQADRAPDTSADRLFRSPRATQSIAPSPGGTSHGSPVSGRAGRPPISTDGRRDRMSTSTSQRNSPGSAERSSSKPPSRAESSTGRSVRRSGTPPSRSAPRITGPAAASRQTEARTRSAAGAATDSGRSASSRSGDRRQAAAQQEGNPESKTKSPRRSTTDTKR